MAQTLLIGLGGTGSRVVNNVVKELYANGKRINDGEICCAVLDTNENDNDKIIDTNTGVPVIPTSKAQKIRDYFNEYHHLEIHKWCPQSPSFLEQTMINGASEVRVKSRLAFMDCCESDVIRRLESMINEVLMRGTGSEIQIMLVSSLSGGTGSGMFIQVALWLRKFLHDYELLIQGIFMLPDVFIRTVDDIRNNKATQAKHRANAYAAVKELNAISKIRMGFMNDDDMPDRIVLDKLFDSERDKKVGKAVFDHAFLIDYDGYRCIGLDAITDYEKLVAQLVYMQIFSPMAKDIRSELDNTYTEFDKAKEPLYASCGTSKAVYPRESVKTYCAIRAAKDSLKDGWGKIDSEIKALEDEIKQNENEGIFLNEKFDPRATYISLFEEKIAVKPEDAGRDRFFVSISKDIKNQDTSSSKGTDKVDDLLKLIRAKKIDVVVTSHSGMSPFVLNQETFVADDHSTDELMTKVAEDEAGMDEAVTAFEKKADSYADTIVNSVFPYSMGDVRQDNASSVYGLFAKKDNMGNWSFVHPVAARYMLYKLAEKLRRGTNVSLKNLKDEAKTGGDVKDLFDNKKTKDTEKTPIAFLQSRVWYQKEAGFLDDFENRYAQFINTKVSLCEKYEKEYLQVTVYRKLAQRVEALIKHLESFFKKIGQVQDELQKDINLNVAETKGTVGKIRYVLGDVDAKEFIYKSLDMELDRSDSEINKMVMDSVYGVLCAEKREAHPENARYKDLSIMDAFILGVVNAFRQRTVAKKENNERVNLDIYSAVCQESDVQLKKLEDEKRKRDLEEGIVSNRSRVISNINYETGEIVKDNSKAQRYQIAFDGLKKELVDLAAPPLHYGREITDDALGTVTTRKKTFWGFCPDIADACKTLGVNTELQADSAYPKNELYCFRGIYGLNIKYVEKFNEFNDSNEAYYPSYSMCIEEMSAAYLSLDGPKALVRTPHIDLNWHRILPALTAEKQREEVLKFYRGFWLAIAYGMINVDKDGNLTIKRPIHIGYGDFEEVDAPIMFNHSKITKTEIIKLINALQSDSEFTKTNITDLEKRFKGELEELVDYVNTDVFKGLTPKRDVLHPIDLICRYNELPRHDVYVTKRFIKALESLMGDMVKAYQTERSDEKCEKATFGLCKRIFDSSARIKGKNETFKSWVTKFTDLKL